MGVVERVESLVAPLLTAQGLEVIDVEHAGGVVRITVDRPGGVDLEAIAGATRAVSRALDDADPVPGRYTLEVSSPGLERPLRRPEHFVRAIGADISVKLYPGVEGDRRIAGKLVAADDSTVTVVLDDGTERSIDHADVAKARTVFEWGPAPKPGKRPAGKPEKERSERASAGPASDSQGGRDR